MNVEAKKRALRMFTYGVYLMSARDGEDLSVAVVTWVSQASFEPPLVMVAVRAERGLHALVERTGMFALNILAAGQKDMAQTFFRPARLEDGTISGYAYEPGPRTGAPLLLDAPAWLECRVTDRVAHGDHTVVVAEVIEAGVRNPEAMPLALAETGWSYGG